MIYYTNTHGLYYNSQFDLDKVKQEINTIRNLQKDLTLKLTQLDQVYGVQVPSNLKTRLEDLTNLEKRVKTVEQGGNSDYIIDEIKLKNLN
jgi:predicted MPP superfamily phosphohydrolase